MRRIALSILMLLLAAPLSAADKTHQQMMAEIRMLQEQQLQLLQMISGLSETMVATMKTLGSKIDDQSGANRKAFADQKLVVDAIAEGVRVLREKADDTNVRLSSVTQELEALRQTISTMPSPAPISTAPPGAGDPAQPPTTAVNPPVPSPQPAPPSGISPQRMYDNSFADYASGQYDLAVLGFDAFIKSFPRHDKADDAQLNIGNALYGAGKYREAVAAYQKVISDYPQSDSVAPAYYKLGQTYESLKELDLAKKAYEMVTQKYPTVVEATLAQNRLTTLNRQK